ncbi:sulfotransferase [Clostridium thermobutyricum]|uniref:sulfotransferase n=1 Tax=Clostridium thermobutyricum TaxID=29372 RepID=UPI002942052F|nr:sulfotransferase [Clostridium thermobutyricum]
MRIITCASYHGTGSSAITDLLSEYSNCYSMSDYEFRFVQDPEGISDLEYNLVENHHRLNSGHALKRYKNKVDFLAGNILIKKYELFFNNKWKKYSYEYIESLSNLKYEGYWHQDVLDKGKFFYIRKRLINKFLQKTIWFRKKEKSLCEMPNEIIYCSNPTEEEFLNLTKLYMDRLFKEANKLNLDNIIVDQLVPASNIDRYLRYFNDIKVIVVERDPRDLYCLSKYIWKEKVIPIKNVDEFCKWYKYTRNHRKNENINSKNSILIQFEDLIYKYDETKNRIENWLGFEEKDHIKKKEFLNPNVSKKNTKLWEKLNIPQEDIRYIEENLQEYLYEF